MISQRIPLNSKRRSSMNLRSDLKKCGEKGRPMGRKLNKRKKRNLKKRKSLMIL
jgi:hypothetical protein